MTGVADGEGPGWTAPPATVSWDVMDLLGEIEDIGRDPVRSGYSRHVFEPAEMELRQWFTRRARALRLAVEPDRNGNIWAYWGARGPDTIAVGSHLDSVPGGGALDGPLGVASALSAVAWLKSHGVTPSRPVAVVAAAEEAADEHGCALEVAEESYVDAVTFNPALRDRLGDGLGGPPVLATGAGHDAGVLAGELPTAMLFVRNPTGVSHAPFETASDDDGRAGVAALTAVLRDLAG